MANQLGTAPPIEDGSAANARLVVAGLDAVAPQRGCDLAGGNVKDTDIAVLAPDGKTLLRITSFHERWRPRQGRHAGHPHGVITPLAHSVALHTGVDKVPPDERRLQNALCSRYPQGVSSVRGARPCQQPHQQRAPIVREVPRGG